MRVRYALQVQDGLLRRTQRGVRNFDEKKSLGIEVKSLVKIIKIFLD